MEHAVSIRYCSMYYQQSAMNIANTPRIDHVLLPVTFDLIYSKKQAELGHQLCILSSLQSGAYEHCECMHDTQKVQPWTFDLLNKTVVVVVLLM